MAKPASRDVPMDARHTATGRFCMTVVDTAGSFTGLTRRSSGYRGSQQQHLTAATGRATRPV
jgi:hypothetical protein